MLRSPPDVLPAAQVVLSGAGEQERGEFLTLPGPNRLAMRERVGGTDAPDVGHAHVVHAVLFNCPLVMDPHHAMDEEGGARERHLVDDVLQPPHPSKQLLARLAVLALHQLLEGHRPILEADGDHLEGRVRLLHAVMVRLLVVLEVESVHNDDLVQDLAIQGHRRSVRLVRTALGDHRSEPARQTLFEVAAVVLRNDFELVQQLRAIVEDACDEEEVGRERLAVAKPIPVQADVGGVIGGEQPADVRAVAALGLSPLVDLYVAAAASWIVDHLHHLEHGDAEEVLTQGRLLGLRRQQRQAVVQSGALLLARQALEVRWEPGARLLALRVETHQRRVQRGLILPGVAVRLNPAHPLDQILGLQPAVIAATEVVDLVEVLPDRRRGRVLLEISVDLRAEDLLQHLVVALGWRLGALSGLPTSSRRRRCNGLPLGRRSGRACGGWPFGRRCGRRCRRSPLGGRRGAPWGCPLRRRTPKRRIWLSLALV
mmetsp:Transcript_56259/g.147748  ORF Transcript_56259/g.147748 Transcript_56259/m.147748 type:complete len:485 (+) Transcript_56259:229-1683(+)